MYRWELIKKPLFHLVLILLLVPTLIYLSPVEHNLFNQDLLEINIDQIYFQSRELESEINENMVFVRLLIYNHLLTERKVGSIGFPLDISILPYDSTESIDIIHDNQYHYWILKPGLSVKELTFKISYQTQRFGGGVPLGIYNFDFNLCLIREKVGRCLNKLNIDILKFHYLGQDQVEWNIIYKKRSVLRNVLTHHILCIITSIIVSTGRIKQYQCRKQHMVELYPIVVKY